MMIRSQIEFEIREPTGLRLGTYDIFTIRQKIYTGDLQPRCEYLNSHGAWGPLADNPLFAEVIWLLHKDGIPVEVEAGQKTAPRIAGWSTAAGPATTSSAPGPASAGASTEPVQKKKGLLGRFFGKG